MTILNVIEGDFQIVLVYVTNSRAEVKPDDSMWTLLDGKTVQISMEKLDAMKWSAEAA